MKEHVRVLGVRFDMATVDSATAAVAAAARAREGAIMVTPNPEGVMLARKSPTFAAALAQARFSFADGVGITWAARKLGTPLSERVRGVDTAFSVLKTLGAQGEFSVYFLGGKPGVAEKAAENMAAKHPNLRVAGAHHGFFLKDKALESRIISEINTSAPDIVVLCLGMPKAEEWAAANKLNCGVVMCVGGTIDVMAGAVRLAPAWIRAIGMEWLYRLLCQPSRFVRMLAIPKFIFAVLKERNRK